MSSKSRNVLNKQLNRKIQGILILEEGITKLCLLINLLLELAQYFGSATARGVAKVIQV